MSIGQYNGTAIVSVSLIVNSVCIHGAVLIYINVNRMRRLMSGGSQVPMMLRMILVTAIGVPLMAQKDQFNFLVLLQVVVMEEPY